MASCQLMEVIGQCGCATPTPNGCIVASLPPVFTDRYMQDVVLCVPFDLLHARSCAVLPRSEAQAACHSIAMRDACCFFKTARITMYRAYGSTNHHTTKLRCSARSLPIGSVAGLDTVWPVLRHLDSYDLQTEARRRKAERCGSSACAIPC